MIEIFGDGDACPVKDEVYAVAARLDLAVVVVANQRINVPRDLGVERVAIADGRDAADDWIARQIREGDVVVTADIPLAARCLAVGAAKWVPITSTPRSATFSSIERRVEALATGSQSKAADHSG